VARVPVVHAQLTPLKINSLSNSKNTNNNRHAANSNSPAPPALATLRADLRAGMACTRTRLSQISPLVRVAVVAVLGITVLAKAPVSPLPAVVKLPSTPLLVLKTPVLEVRTTVAEVTAVAVVSGTSPMVAVVVRPRCEDL
jgi:hypothetical protein